MQPVLRVKIFSHACCVLYRIATICADARIVSKDLEKIIATTKILAFGVGGSGK
ncbi:MAG TPA: hypothetical protein VGA68_08615 [Woeseiaceae bacterium]|jgi:hypothetical protein